VARREIVRVEALMTDVRWRIVCRCDLFSIHVYSVT